MACHRLDRSSFEVRWKQKIFYSPHLFRHVQCPSQPPVKWVSRNLLGGTPRGAIHPAPTSVKVKIAYGNTWNVTERPLPLTYICKSIVQYNVFKLHVKYIYWWSIDPCWMHSYLLHIDCARFKVITAVLLNAEILWHVMACRVKVTAIPVQVWRGPEGSRSLGIPNFQAIDTWMW